MIIIAYYRNTGSTIYSTFLQWKIQFSFNFTGDHYVYDKHAYKF